MVRIILLNNKRYLIPGFRNIGVYVEFKQDEKTIKIPWTSILYIEETQEKK